MIQWLKELDEVLRGHKADPAMLAEGTGHIRIKPLVCASVLLGIIYGLCMGLYAVLTRTPPCFTQMFASAIKVPMLFLLTLIITFPSLYVFSALLGVRLGPKDTLRLILAPVAANLAVLASLGPITGFFTLSTSSYPFMKLLNFFFFAVSGLIGLKVLLSMLSRLDRVQAEPVQVKQDPAPDTEAGDGGSDAEAPPKSAPCQLLPERDMARTTFRIWLIIYGLVGAQMGWVLRPFIGAPGLAFEWFRAREANVFVDLLRTIGELFGV